MKHRERYDANVAFLYELIGVLAAEVIQLRNQYEWHIEDYRASAGRRR